MKYGRLLRPALPDANNALLTSENREGENKEKKVGSGSVQKWRGRGSDDYFYVACACTLRVISKINLFCMKISTSDINLYKHKTSVLYVQRVSSNAGQSFPAKPKHPIEKRLIPY